MHRGTVFIITKDKDNKFKIQKSTEFNGGMGIDNLGGAIYIHSNKTMTLNNSILENNSARQGGAIYNNGISTVTNVSMKYNSATESGGAVFTSYPWNDFSLSGNMTLNDCNITNNKAEKGSGIYLNRGNLTLNNIKLLDNQASAKEFSDVYNKTVNNKKYIAK